MPESIPKDVERYKKEVEKDNPSYSEEQVWATAWSIYCKHKNPGSSHCKQDDYLKGQGKKEASETEEIVKVYSSSKDGGNGGASFRIGKHVKKIMNSYDIHFSMSHFGTSTEATIDLMDVGFVEELLRGLTATREMMLEDAKTGREPRTFFGSELSKKVAARFKANQKP
jgi:hypothetical protein